MMQALGVPLFRSAENRREPGRLSAEQEKSSEETVRRPNPPSPPFLEGKEEQKQKIPLYPVARSAGNAG